MVDAQISKEDLQALGAMVQRFQRDTGATIDEAVMFAAVKVAGSGRAISKTGKKNRESIDNPEWRQAKGSFAWARKQRAQGKEIPIEAQQAMGQLNAISPFLIRFMRQDGNHLLLPSWEKKDPRRLIKHVQDGGTRGLAKNTWNVMAGKLNAMRKRVGGNSTSRFYSVAKYTEKLGETSGSVVARLKNKLLYLEDAYPGITAQAVQKGTAALKHEAERLMARAIARANR